MIFSKSRSQKNREADSPPQGETQNPYMTARQTWNSVGAARKANARMWQVAGLLGILVGLAGVGGMIHTATQSTFVPYVIEVDSHGRAFARGPVTPNSNTDPRIVRAAIRDFISDVRTVTPDAQLLRENIFEVYAMLNAGDPAYTKITEWWNGTQSSSPFQRASKVMVHVTDMSVLQQTKKTWQVDWTEVKRARNGEKLETRDMRALVTIYQQPPTAEVSQKQMRQNPFGIYVRDISWSALPE